MRMEDVYQLVGNPTTMKKAFDYVQDGRVITIHAENESDGVRYTARVRGRYDLYQTWYKETDTQIVGGCTCPAFERTRTACKHIAALMIENMARQEYEREARQRQQEYEKRRREEQARENEAFINRMIQLGEKARMPAEQTDGRRIRLYPVLERADMQCVELEFKVGREGARAYIVRNPWDFAQRVANGDYFAYGKGLAFAHDREMIDDRDLPLLDHALLLTQAMPRQNAQTIPLTGALLDQTMRLLLGGMAEMKREGETPIRVRVSRGEITPAVALEKKGDGAWLRVRAQSVALGSAGAYEFLPSGIVCAFDADFRRIAALLKSAAERPDGFVIPKKQIAPVCSQIIAPARATVVRGRELVQKHTPMEMTARFYIDCGEENALLCRPEWLYGAARVHPGEDAPHIRRDTFRENQLLSRVQQIFPQKKAEWEYAFDGEDDACYELLTTRLHELENAGEVMISDRLARMNVKTSRAMTFGMSRQGAQLLVHADLGGLTQADLDAAYAAYRQKRKYVRLKNGTFLSEDALEQAAQISQVLDSAGMTAEEAQKGGAMPLERAMYLEQALADRKGVSMDMPKALETWMERLSAAQKTQAEPPRALHAELRPYQKTGLSWLSALSDAGFGGILADDMGLGKTVQTLALLLREMEQGRAVCALVVCPASLQLNWRGEAAKFAPDLPCEVLMGTAAARQKQIEAWHEGILVTSYDQLRRDVMAYAGKPMTHVLLDEAQNIKNAASQAAKAVKTLQAAHRFALTGTPIENRLSELWSIFDFLMPGYLHAYKRFRERFEAPIVQDADEQARQNLHLMVAPFILRRMKQDVLDDLPEKIETVMTSEMTPGQAKVYHAYAEKLMQEAESELADPQGRMKLLAGLTRLRQLCCDPRLCLEEYAAGSGKLDQLIELAGGLAAQGHRMLIFSQFTSMLALLEEALYDAGLQTLKLTGETDKIERMALVEQFNSGDIPVFLISLKAGGTGLNLTGADVVIHYDPWWNTAARNQATDRAYRIGQTKGVQVFDLIAADTIEERIVLLQQEKKALSDGVLLGEDSLFTVDASALRAILKG